MNRLKIVQNASRDYAIQTWLAGGKSWAVYTGNDALSAAVYQGTTLTPLFIPTVGWWTNSSQQTGYTQGQVLVGISNAQSALLIPAGRYMLIVNWSPSANLSASGVIVRMQLIVEAKQNL